MAGGVNEPENSSPPVDRPTIQVDELDFGILREMLLSGGKYYYRGDRVPAEKIATALKVNRKTAAARLKRMTEAGFWLPLTLGLNPSRVGIVRAKVFLENPQAREEEAIEALCHVEGVQGILASTEGFDVVVFAEDDASLAARIELARRIVKADRVVLDIHSTRDFPKLPPYPLTSLDARLLAALLTDARRSFRSIAPGLGVAPRTLERRFERLSKEGVANMLPGGDGHMDFTGMLLAASHFYLSGDAKARHATAAELTRILPNHVVRNLVADRLALLVLYASSPPELDEQLRQAGRVPGVERVVTRMVTWIGSSPQYPAWLASVLERRGLAGRR